MKQSKPTSFDIAKRAGVSQPTVSRALRNSPLVNKETRELVQAIAKEMNYYAKAQKRIRKSLSTKTLAVFFAESPFKAANPFLFSILNSATRQAARLGYDVLLSNQHYSKSWSVSDGILQRADGLIFLGHEDYDVYFRKIGLTEEEDIPFVAWGQVQAGQNTCFVGSDNMQGGYDACRHLINLGHKKIAFIGNKGDSTPELAARHHGYVKALLESNMVVDPSLQVNSDSLEEDAAQALQRLLQKSKDFSAIFCASDLIAMGAIRALEAHGKKVPDDIAVVGFDDIGSASLFQPQLTTVKQDAKLAGRMLIEQLVSAIEGKAPKPVQLRAELMVRDSCGANLKS